jgi:predicted alpha/beta superfamily hydrolase
MIAVSSSVAGPPDAPVPTAIPAVSVPTERPHTLTGMISLYHAFPAKHLPARDVLVYLPPGYDAPENGQRRYPVLYLQDGQNCFDGATSFIPGKEWQVDETVERLIDQGKIEPIIIVGVYNTGMNRVNEYTPVKDDRDHGGQADRYGQWMIEELKPFIDRAYRTQSEPENTGLCGSSLGGLVTLYLGLTHPEVFRRLAVMSPSVWWAERSIVTMVNTLKAPLPLKIWLDIGTEEGYAAVPDAHLLRDALIARGWNLGKDLVYFEAQGAHHNEEAWAARVEPSLKFLFPPHTNR